MADIDNVGAAHSVGNNPGIDAAEASPRPGAVHDATPAVPHASYNVLRDDRW